jgi:hypothetical protein
MPQQHAKPLPFSAIFEQHIISTAEEITTTTIKVYLSEFDNLGGVINFKFFKVYNASSDRDAHLLTANRRLHLLGQGNRACQFILRQCFCYKMRQFGSLSFQSAFFYFDIFLL